MTSSAEIIGRIAADNDPRNGTVAERIIRMCEQPAREPDADGLYADRTLLLNCERDLGGCGHQWRAPDPGDVFAECPNCHKGTGALV